MREADETGSIVQTGHAIALDRQLFRNRAVTDNNTRDGRRMVSADEEAARSPLGNIGWRRGRCVERQLIRRGSKVSDAGWVVEVTSCIKKANTCLMWREGTVGVEKCSVTGGTCHGTVVGVCEDSAGFGVVGADQASKKEIIMVDGWEVGRIVAEGESGGANGVKDW